MPKQIYTREISSSQLSYPATGVLKAATCTFSRLKVLLWKYLIHFRDVGRTLTGASYSNITGMTIESCIAYCDSQGFIYAGTEYSYECCKLLFLDVKIFSNKVPSFPVCGNSIVAGATNASNSDCQAPCSGDVTEPCGGPNRLNLFWSGSLGPQINPGSGLWSYVGCYT